MLYASFVRFKEPIDFVLTEHGPRIQVTMKMAYQLIDWLNEWMNARIPWTLNSHAMPAAKWQIYILYGFK